MTIAITLHVLSAVIWVGGMFFSFVCLRPAAAALEPPARLRLWESVLTGFFRWVWLAVAVLLVTGFWMIFGRLGGMKAVGPQVHLMLALGILMMLLAAHVYFAPLKRLKRSLAGNDLEAAARSLNQIRMFIGINLTLGLLVIAIASGGRYLFH